MKKFTNFIVLSVVALAMTAETLYGMKRKSPEQEDVSREENASKISRVNEKQDKEHQLLAAVQEGNQVAAASLLNEYAEQIDNRRIAVFIALLQKTSNVNLNEDLVALIEAAFAKALAIDFFQARPTAPLGIDNDQWYCSCISSLQIFLALCANKPDLCAEIVRHKEDQNLDAIPGAKQLIAMVEDPQPENIQAFRRWLVESMEPIMEDGKNKGILRAHALTDKIQGILNALKVTESLKHISFATGPWDGKSDPGVLQALTPEEAEILNTSCAFKNLKCYAFFKVSVPECRHYCANVFYKYSPEGFKWYFCSDSVVRKLDRDNPERSELYPAFAVFYCKC